MISDAYIEDIVVKYLRRAESSSGTPEVEAAVQHYIATRDDATQKRILSIWIERSETFISLNPINDRRKRQRTEEPEEPNERQDREPNQSLDQTQDREPGQEHDQELQGRSNKPPGQVPDEGSAKEPDDASDERKAVAFFTQRQRDRSQEGETLKPALTWRNAQKAITALRKGYEWNCENDVGDLWASKEPATAYAPFEDSSPLQRLSILHGSVLSSVHSNEVKRRITALLIYHECKENRIPVGKGKGKEEEKKEKWNDKFAKLTGLSFETAILVHNTAYAWIKFIKAWGFGGLVMPGPGHRDVFERKLSVEHATDLWAFCKIYEPEMALKVEKIHEIARSLLTKAVQIYRGNEKTLEASTRSPLAELCRIHKKQSTDQSFVLASSSVMDSSLPTGMDMLAAAAVAHHRYQPQDGLGSQVSGLDIAPTAEDDTAGASGAQNGDPHDRAIRTPATQVVNRMRHQIHGKDFPSQRPQDVAARSAAGSGQGLQNASSLQPPFWPRMDSCGLYATTPQNTAFLHSAPSYPPFSQAGQPDQLGMDIDDSWDEDSYPSLFNRLIQPYSYE